MSDLPLAAKLPSVVGGRDAAAEVSTTAPALTLEGLGVSFGRRQAVRDVSLEIPSGRITGIIGPSGCGKTTLLRAMNRMHDTVAGVRVTGSVKLGDFDIYGPGSEPVLIRTRVGMVFQRANPFPTLSIYENVVAGLRFNGIRKKSVLDRAAEEALRAAALWDRVSDSLRGSAMRLSGGEQQRLCIARALAVQPEVLLMDEPTSALDPIATLKIEELLVELRARVTIVIVTHSLQQAGRVSDHCAFMMIGEDRVGTLVEAGPTRQMFDTPRDPRTEEYVTGRFG
jgi:phosphate transport system ATP-binding protein